MIGIADRTVYRTIISFQVGTDQDIVYAEIKLVPVVGNS